MSSYSDDCRGCQKRRQNHPFLCATVPCSRVTEVISFPRASNGSNVRSVQVIAIQGSCHQSKRLSRGIPHDRLRRSIYSAKGPYEAWPLESDFNTSIHVHLPGRMRMQYHVHQWAVGNRCGGCSENLKIGPSFPDNAPAFLLIATRVDQLVECPAICLSWPRFKAQGCTEINPMICESDTQPKADYF